MRTSFLRSTLAVLGLSLVVSLCGCLGGVSEPADAGETSEGEGEGGGEGEGSGEGEGEGGSEGEGEGGEGEGTPDCQVAVAEYPGSGIFGASCAEESECASGVCASMVGRHLCSKFCLDDSECPTAQSWHCQQEIPLVDGRRACVCVWVQE